MLSGKFQCGNNVAFNKNQQGLLVWFETNGSDVSRAQGHRKNITYVSNALTYHGTNIEQLVCLQ